MGKSAGDNHSIPDGRGASTLGTDARHHALFGRHHPRPSVHHWTRDCVLHLLDENLEGSGTSRVCSPRLGVPPRGRFARGGATDSGTALRGAKLVAWPVHDASDAELLPGWIRSVLETDKRCCCRILQADNALCAAGAVLIIAVNFGGFAVVHALHRQIKYATSSSSRSRARRRSYVPVSAGFTSSAPSRARKRIEDGGSR